jgi:hypothetical protein
MNQAPHSQGRAVLKASGRVQRCRDRLRAEDCGCLDVWIGSGWIRGAHRIAEHQKRPLWKLVQDALKIYIAQRAQINRPPKDRDR